MNVKRLITLVLRGIGAIGEGEDPSTDALVDGLDVLNGLLSSWENDGTMISYATRESFSLPVSADINIGSGLTLNTPVPIAIDGVTITNSSGDITELSPLREESVRSLRGSAYDGTPYAFFFARVSDVAGVLLLSCLPEAGGTIDIRSRKPYSSNDGILENVDIPNSYLLAMQSGLQVLLSPVYGKTATETAIALAASYYAAIKAKVEAERQRQERVWLKHETYGDRLFMVDDIEKTRLLSEGWTLLPEPSKAHRLWLYHAEEQAKEFIVDEVELSHLLQTGWSRTAIRASFGASDMPPGFPCLSTGFDTTEESYDSY